MSAKILVALSTFAQYGQEPLDLLKKSGLSYTINPVSRRLSAEDILKFAQDCSGIVAGVEPYTSEVLSRLPQLKCISRCGVGIDNIDQSKAKSLGIKVLNTPDPVIVPVAELTIGMMLDLLRHITWHTVSLRKSQWQKKGGRNLRGQTVGIIGLGRIGKKVAEFLNHFGANVIATDLNPDQLWAQENHVAIVSIEEILTNADIVTLHLSTNQNAPFFLGEKEIRRMKAGAILLNLSRGELIDEQALFDALKEERLGGVGIDVFPQEPYLGKLTSLDNVIMTPHVATLTRESRLQMETQAVQNLLQSLSKE
ncbi:MAG: phosphoglycerate dehydrogenase [Candidatus Omnitrophica bacterium]|nr:phosphoglycerate dehydrogenase [Candidatus Omnitrophota bacterium]